MRKTIAAVCAFFAMLTSCQVLSDVQDANDKLDHLMIRTMS